MVGSVRSVEDLREYSPAALERQANIILYGDPLIFTEAVSREIFYRQIYIPRGLNQPLVYTPPRQARWGLTCDKCGRLRSDMGGSLCSFCWRLQARLRFYDRRGYADYWERQLYGGFDESGNHCGITMPVVEWWDDRDMPAVPNRIALARWNLDKARHWA